MASELINSKTVVKRLDRVFIVNETVDETTYDAVVAGTYKLPDYSFVVLEPTTGDKVVKLALEGDDWDTAIQVSAVEA